MRKNISTSLGLKILSFKKVCDLKNEQNAGEVISISVDGNTEFEKQTNADENVPIVISYHAIEEQAIPFSSEEIVKRNYNEVASSLNDIGFYNITETEVDDIEYDNLHDGEIETMTIAGDSDFSVNDVYPINSEIVIKYSNRLNHVSFDLECDENLWFSKYDIKIYFDDEYIGTLEHGTEDKFKIYAKDGQHTIEFVNDEDSEVSAAKQMNIQNDRIFRYQLHCSSDKISIKNFKPLNAPYTNKSAEKVKSKKVRETFENQGFKDITLVPLNDLSKAQKEKKYRVRKISINGDENFSKKDDFYSDSKVKVYYHSAKNIEMKASSYDLEKLNAKEVAKKLKKAGFTNVRMKKYEGFTFSEKENYEIQEISVNDDSSFREGDKYPWDSKIVIYYYYHEYKKYSAAQLIRDLENNSYAAKDKYEDKYVIVTGKIAAISASLPGFVIDSTDEIWSYMQINCVALDDAAKEKLKKTSVGNTITVRGKITNVEDSYYMLKVLEIV